MKYALSSPIYFTGFMATGKSRLGELTAAALGWEHFDSDTEIERQTERTISEIFAEEGEHYFRQLEVEIIHQLSRKEHAVISLGGGSLKNPEVMKIVKNRGHLVGLWAKPETILERVNRKNTRPLLAGLNDEEKLAKINHLLNERKALYAQADFQMESREDIPHHILIKRIVARLQLEDLNELSVDLGHRSYPIIIHENLNQHVGVLAERCDCANQYVVVTDANLKAIQKEAIQKLSNVLDKCKVFYFKPGEKEKNLSSINRLITYMLKNNFSRKTTIVAFGGGIVGDMAGFTASIYLRGIPFIQVPTTLLAMVDSSVGGKTGVNHRMGKNLIGTFYQPKAVAISLDVLKTLPSDEYLAGMAEVIKYGVIWDSAFFELLEEKTGSLLEKDFECLQKVVRRCCEIKAEVVAQDEKECGLRAILNYGHTFAHAIETYSGYNTLTHGFAVALGMRVAARLAVLLGKFLPSDEIRQNNLLDAFGMPAHFRIDKEAVWELMSRDKKVEGGVRNYILPVAIGSVERVSNISKKLVYEAWDAIRSEGTSSETPSPES